MKFITLPENLNLLTFTREHLVQTLPPNQLWVDFQTPGLSDVIHIIFLQEN